MKLSSPPQKIGIKKEKKSISKSKDKKNKEMNRERKKEEELGRIKYDNEDQIKKIIKSNEAINQQGLN